MLAGKTLLNYTNLFSPNGYKNNDRVIYISIICKQNMAKENASLEFKLQNRGNKNLSLRRNKPQ